MKKVKKVKGGLIKKYKEIEAKKKEIEKEYKSLKSQIFQEMEEMETSEITQDGLTLAWIVTERSSFDTSVFRVEKPDLYQEYLKTTKVNSLKFAKGR